MKKALIIVMVIVLAAPAIKAQLLPQTITADSLMAAMKCPDDNCANKFAGNNLFYLKVKIDLGGDGVQHVYEGNETYSQDDGKCSLPDGLSIIMEKKAVTEITYKTVLESTYTDIVYEFVKYGFHAILTETEEDPETKKDVVFTTMESDKVTAYRIVTGTETKVVDGKNCPMYTITIGFSY